MKSNGEVSTVISESQIRELPTITRNVYDLVSVAGNVSKDDASDRRTGYAINGQRSASPNILLDGSANNDEFTATVGQAVPLDSVQEFSVVTSNFSAQYGRATGGVVNVVTKSGTNSFRGTAYEFYRSDALATNDFDNKSNGIEKGEFTRHQTGFSIGGPLQRDRLHFFSNLEYIRVRSNDTLIGWVPTPEFIAASAPATRAFFDRYGQGASINGPVLSRAEVSDILGATPGAFNALPAGLPVFGRVQKSLPIDAGGGDPQDNYQWVTRVDYSLSSNTQMYVRYAYQNQEAQPGTNANSLYDGYDTGYINHNHNVLASLTKIIGSSFTSQSKLVWNLQPLQRVRALRERRLEPRQPRHAQPGRPLRILRAAEEERALGYLDAFDPMLDWGYADFDVRHRLAVSGIWQLPFAKETGGLTSAIAGGWQLNWIFTARTGYPFTLWDCTNGLALCMRAEDRGDISRNAVNGSSTGNPNEFNLLDLTPVVAYAGSYTHPLTANSDFGPYPASMTERNAFRAPGIWNVDFSLSKRVRFGTQAVQFRVEAYILFNHANMYARIGSADVSSADFITGYKDGNRRIQLGLKYEF